MMKEIKISEIFYSIQGEGRYTGVPSIFLRTVGCNLRCRGFGMQPGVLTDEIEKIDPKNYKSYDELPLSKTGCDSYPSSDPRFKHLSPSRDIDTIVSDIMELLPHKTWKEEHLVITGGEPLLGWQRAYPDLLDHPNMKNLRELTFETNGTQALTDKFANYLDSWQWHHFSKSIRRPDFEREITFSVSPKLSVSGEPREKAIRPENIIQYQRYGFTYLKFVVASEEDVNEALEVAEIYRNAGFNGPVYFMPVGGVESVYQLNNKRVAELAMKHGVRYSDRLHIPLWGNAWNT